MKDFPISNNSSYWNSPEAVAKYATESHLLRGERLALEACFVDGLAGRRVLDLGCGGGRTTYFLHKLGAEVIGVDISQNLIRAARERAPHINFREGRAESLNFEDEFFDVVLFSFNGLDCLDPKENRLKAIHEVWRVLRPEGSFIFSHHNLAAFLFGWYKFLRPWKLWFRATNIMNGNVFLNEVYLCAADSGGLRIYYAWPSQIIADLCERRFELMYVCPNSLLLALLQRTFRTNWLTKCAEPWPYYIFKKLNYESASNVGKAFDSPFLPRGIGL